MSLPEDSPVASLGGAVSLDRIPRTPILDRIPHTPIPIIPKASRVPHTPPNTSTEPASSASRIPVTPTPTGDRIPLTPPNTSTEPAPPADSIADIPVADPDPSSAFFTDFMGKPKSKAAPDLRRSKRLYREAFNEECDGDPIPAQTAQPAPSADRIAEWDPVCDGDSIPAQTAQPAQSADLFAEFDPESSVSADLFAEFDPESSVSAESASVSAESASVSAPSAPVLPIVVEVVADSQASQDSVSDAD